MPRGGRRFVFRESRRNRLDPGVLHRQVSGDEPPVRSLLPRDRVPLPKYWGDKRFNDPKAPVVGVSVNDALKYARWVGKQLPTEEQWEKACRGTDGRKNPWGDDPVSEERACYGRDPLEGGTDDVKARPDGESPYGVRDLVGNAWEWTATTDTDPRRCTSSRAVATTTSRTSSTACCVWPPSPRDKFETIGFRCVKSA